MNLIIQRAEKYKSFYVKSKTWEFLTIGWIYSFWNRITTFSILTAGASPLMAEIQNVRKRMPLVLEGNSAEAWLLADLIQQEMTALMVPYPGGEMLGSQRGMDGVSNTRLKTNVEEVLKPL